MHVAASSRAGSVFPPRSLAALGAGFNQLWQVWVEVVSGLKAPELAFLKHVSLHIRKLSLNY